MTYVGLDLDILEELCRDGRASLRTIAERLDVSTSTVSQRVKQLESKGVIQGYRPVLDYGKLGYRLTAITKIKARGVDIPRIVEELVKEETLVDVYEITGDYDVLVVGKYPDEESMNREIKRMLAHPEIEGTNTSIVLSIAKEGGDLELRALAPEG
ncbi:MAG: Lrp/AsnC family transcriptional regulator [Gemmatimonadetes bacterium]|uniref:Lrp/AsnC family transcriptional regulator n=1 Tax=Candidatus Kutchimonas denitrificans TaxID=3056748 RepID=A0AAE4ZAH3_9BACT|nr:Lrp/AsnC family transcriptional regulator [Gemmatimonadota bacterium]NIR76309.1 Lrp/AsnC family transcriptional regulator [Candidatus Kutchimonas denitrificans]NIS02332.1 Lrp/AsnC family transcriptional regulator [Gemmatimonadota bacterium]NIT68151.1 Lrp/AsnC family transcriptional regulator [Gemmatimonadota bacterium]NIU54375.1 winged helix-turn-helix transcriptional regulator [Gemmatimonadota bacterium]